MGYDKCPICGKYDFSEKHKCHPKWQVCVPNWDCDEWSEVYAHNPQCAAEQTIQERDDECDIVNDSIRVRVKTDDGIVEFDVYGEPEIVYTATRIEPKQNSH